MRSFRALATLLCVAALGACADSPTAATPPAEGVASSATTGQIQIGSVVYYDTYWRVHLSTPAHSSISYWTWSHYGGTGANPWGNNAYKYQVDRTTPGCVTVELVTHYTNGSTSYDTESVKVGGYTGLCAVPA